MAVINGIEWYLDKLINNDKKAKISPLSIQMWKHIDRLPLSRGDIYFNSDFWDFSGLCELPRKKGHLTYDFAIIPYEYRDYIKGLILRFFIIDKMAISTIKGNYYRLVKIANFLQSRHIFDYSIITLKTVTDYYQSVTSIKMREESKKSYKETLFKFLKYINLHYPELDYGSIYNFLQEYSNASVLKSERNAGKTGDIPDKYFDSMIACALEDIYDADTNIKGKRIASIILLLSQIGMRVGELVLLEVDKKEDIFIFDDAESVSYLEFKTFKTIKSKEFEWTKAVLNDLSLLAYITLEQIVQNSKLLSNSLIPPSGKVGFTAENTIRGWILQFIARHRSEINCINQDDKDLPGFKRLKIGDLKALHLITKKMSDGLDDSDIISIPTPHQFRVAVCTRLYKKGYDIDWIREYMNHLTEEMTVHYMRHEKQSEKDKEFAKAILKDVVTGDSRLLGRDANILMDKINQFITSNGFNIAEDADIIVSKLAGKVPIREKAEGFCIKGAFGRKCAHDRINDELYCAFDLCPNHCFTYKQVDITYNRYLTKKKIVEYNAKNGFSVEAESESNKIRRLVRERLILELNELQYEISNKGIENIKTNTPEIVHIIDKLEEIITEVRAWMNL